MVQIANIGLLQRRGVRQFIKFCIIGATSMVIDVGILLYLTRRLHWHWIPSQVISFALAVTNGFIWNSLWTFRGMGSGKKHELYLKFVGVNIIGLALNIFIMKFIFFLFTGHIIHHGNPTDFQLKVAKGVAVVIVAAWNFLANKSYTFKDARGTVVPQEVENASAA